MISYSEVEHFSETSRQECLDFLRLHENYSLFLLGNLEAQGDKLSDAPNSGNFKLIRSSGKVVAVFCLTRRGNLLATAATSERALLEQILNACTTEAIPIKGLLGEWNFCSVLWKLLKEKMII